MKEKEVVCPSGLVVKVREMTVGDEHAIIYAGRRGKLAQALIRRMAATVRGSDVYEKDPVGNPETMLVKDADAIMEAILKAAAIPGTDTCPMCGMDLGGRIIRRQPSTSSSSEMDKEDTHE